MYQSIPAVPPPKKKLNTVRILETSCLASKISLVNRWTNLVRTARETTSSSATAFITISRTRHDEARSSFWHQKWLTKSLHRKCQKSNLYQFHLFQFVSTGLFERVKTLIGNSAFFPAICLIGKCKYSHMTRLHRLV